MKSRTSPEAIRAAMRASAILQQRLAGRTFSQIGMMMRPPISAQAVHKAYWKTIQSCPPDYRAQRRRLARLRRELALADEIDPPPSTPTAVT